MAEWLKAHAWKACKRETVSRVRIPLSPPFFNNLAQLQIYKYTKLSSLWRQQMIKRFLAVLVFLIFNSNLAKAIEVRANCISGYCQFSLNVLYDWAETLCMDSLRNEPVDLNIARFIIIESGKSCFITDGN